jgi:hypothetical protein
VVTITELAPRTETTLAAAPEALRAYLGLDRHAGELIDAEPFESIYNPGKLLLLATWRDAGAADLWEPGRSDVVDSVRHRHVRVIRDYGMFDRREAPQYYPDLPPRGRAAAGR